MSHHLYNTNAFGNQRSTQEQYRFSRLEVDEDPQRPPYLTESSSRLDFSRGSVRTSDSQGMHPSFPSQSVSYRPEQSRSTFHQVTEGDIDLCVNRHREEMNVQPRGQDVPLTRTHRDAFLSPDVEKIYPVTSDCTYDRHLDRYQDTKSSSSSLDWLEDVKRATADPTFTQDSSSDSLKYAVDTDRRKLYSEQESHISHPRQQDHFFANEQPTPPKISQSRYSPEFASKILLKFGIAKEDLDYLIAYPEDQITPDNIPFLLRQIRAEKAKRTTRAVDSAISKESKIYQPTTVIDYGHSKKYAEDLVDETLKTTYTRFHSGTSMVMMDTTVRNNMNQLVVENVEAVKSYRTSQTSTVTIPNISSSSKLPSLPPPSHEPLNRFGAQAIQTSQIIPGSITQPKKEAEGRVHSAETFKQSNFVSPGGQLSQYGSMMSDSNCGKDIKHQGQTQATGPTAGQQMKVQQTQKPEMTQMGQTRRYLTLFDREPVSSASRVAPVANTTGVAQHPWLRAATPAVPRAAQQPSPSVRDTVTVPPTVDVPQPKVKLFFRASVSSDDSTAAPKRFPHSCLLCKTDCFSLKDWLSHQNSSQHRQNSRLHQQTLTKIIHQSSQKSVSTISEEGHNQDKNNSVSLSSSAIAPHLQSDESKNQSKKLPQKSIFKRRSRSHSCSPRNDSSSHSCSKSQKKRSRKSRSRSRERRSSRGRSPDTRGRRSRSRSRERRSSRGRSPDTRGRRSRSRSRERRSSRGRSPGTRARRSRSRSRERRSSRGLGHETRARRSRSRSRERRSSRGRSHETRARRSRSRSRERRSRRSRSRSHERGSLQKNERKSQRSRSRSSEEQSTSFQGSCHKRTWPQKKKRSGQELSSVETLAKKLLKTSAAQSLSNTSDLDDVVKTLAPVLLAELSKMKPSSSPGSSATAEKKKATAPSSNKEAVKNETKKSNSSTTECSENTQSVQTEAQDPQTSKESAKPVKASPDVPQKKEGGSPTEDAVESNHKAQYIRGGYTVFQTLPPVLLATVKLSSSPGSSCATAKKIEATAQSSDKEAVKNEPVKSNSSKTECTENTASVPTEVQDPQTSKESGKPVKASPNVPQKKEGGSPTDAALESNQKAPVTAPQRKQSEERSNVNAKSAEKSKSESAESVASAPAVKKSQSSTAETERAKTVDTSQMPATTLQSTGKTLDLHSVNISSSEFSGVSGSVACITNLPKYYEGCYTEEDIATILKPFGFEHKHNTIYVLPHFSMAYFVMSSATDMDILIAFFKDCPLIFKNSQLDVNLVTPTIDMSPLQFYTSVIKMGMCSMGDDGVSTVYVMDISPSEIEHLSEAVLNLGFVVNFSPLLNKVFIQFETAQDADRMGVWANLLKTAPSYKIFRMKVPKSSKRVSPPILPDKALPNDTEAICGATVPQSTRFPPRGATAPFWITLRTSPFLFPTVSPWFIFPHFWTVTNEKKRIADPKFPTVMITGLPEGNYKHEDIVKLFWPYFTKRTLHTLYYNVMVLALQKRAFIYFPDWFTCCKFINAHIEIPFHFQNRKLNVHPILEPMDPDPTEEMMYKSMMKLSCIPLSNPDTLEERLLSVAISEMRLDIVMCVMEVVTSIAPVASFLPLANRICIEMADSHSVTRVLSQYKQYKPPPGVMNLCWSKVGPFVTMKGLKRHFERYSGDRIQLHNLPTIQDDDNYESQQREDLEKTTEEDAKHSDEKPTGDEAENVKVSCSLDDPTGEQMDDNVQQTGPQNSTMSHEESHQISDSVTEKAKCDPKGDSETELGPSSQVQDSVPDDQITISEKDSDLVKDDEVTGKALSEEKADVDTSDINSTTEEANKSEDTTEEQSSQDPVTEDQITVSQKDSNLVKDNKVTSEETNESEDTTEEQSSQNPVIEDQITISQKDSNLVKEDQVTSEETECEDTAKSQDSKDRSYDQESPNEDGQKRKSTKKGGATLRSEDAPEKGNIPATRAASRCEGKSPTKQESVIKKYATRRNKDTTGGAPTTDTELVNISEHTVPPPGEDEPVPDTVTIEGPARRRSARRNKEEKLTLTLTEASNKRDGNKEGTCQTVESMNVPTRKTRSGRERTETTAKTDASTENVKTVEEDTPATTVHTASDSQERNEATPKEGNEVTQQVTETNSDVSVPEMVKDQGPAQISDCLEDEGVKDDPPAPRRRRGRPKKNVKVSKTDQTKSNNGSDPPENVQFLESVEPQTASDVTPTDERKDDVSPNCGELTKISDSITGPPKNKEDEVETVCQIDKSVEDDHEELTMTEESDRAQDEFLKNDQDQSNISESISGSSKNKEQEESLCQTESSLQDDHKDFAVTEESDGGRRTEQSNYRTVEEEESTTVVTCGITTTVEASEDVTEETLCPRSDCFDGKQGDEDSDTVEGKKGSIPEINDKSQMSATTPDEVMKQTSPDNEKMAGETEEVGIQDEVVVDQPGGYEEAPPASKECSELTNRKSPALVTEEERPLQTTLEPRPLNQTDSLVDSFHPEISITSDEVTTEAEKEAGKHKHEDDDTDESVNFAEEVAPDQEEVTTRVKGRTKKRTRPTPVKKSTKKKKVSTQDERDMEETEPPGSDGPAPTSTSTESSLDKDPLLLSDTQQEIQKTDTKVVRGNQADVEAPLSLEGNASVDLSDTQPETQKTEELLGEGSQSDHDVSSLDRCPSMVCGHIQADTEKIIEEEEGSQPDHNAPLTEQELQLEEAKNQNLDGEEEDGQTRMVNEEERLSPVTVEEAAEEEEPVAPRGRVKKRSRLTPVRKSTRKKNVSEKREENTPDITDVSPPSLLDASSSLESDLQETGPVVEEVRREDLSASSSSTTHLSVLLSDVQADRQELNAEVEDGGRPDASCAKPEPENQKLLEEEGEADTVVEAVCKQEEEFEPAAKRPRSRSPCEFKLPPYQPDNPLGEEFLVPTLGLFCKVCSVFCMNESAAIQSHCSSQTHHSNLQKHYQNLQQTAPKP